MVPSGAVQYGAGLNQVYERLGPKPSRREYLFIWHG